MTKTTSHFRDQSKLNTLTQITLDNIESLYDFFDVPFRQGSKLYCSPCFIHGGDNPTALNLYYNADYRVHFKCRTHRCEQYFGTSLLSMIRGGLSHIKYGWTCEGDQTVNFDETITFLLQRFNIAFNNLDDSQAFDTSQHDFCRIINSLLIDVETTPTGISRDFYRNSVQIPASYYIERGYSKEILDEYDVGLCTTPYKPLSDRIVIPIYAEDNETIVGFTGRSRFEECSICKSYHDPNKECCYFPKWRHTKDFEKEKHLYNYGNAKPYIQKTGTIVLVESPGNVWRLEEAGIHNSVALLGIALNDAQQYLVDLSGALNVVIIMDNDANNAGQRAAEDIKKQLGRTYNVHIPNISKNDIGDMTVKEVNEEIRPLLEEII